MSIIGPYHITSRSGSSQPFRMSYDNDDDCDKLSHLMCHTQLQKLYDFYYNIVKALLRTAINE